MKEREGKRRKEKERGEERRKCGRASRDTKFYSAKQKNCPVSVLPKQYPLDLQVELVSRGGKFWGI
jgi:hypothetical protein